MATYKPDLTQLTDFEKEVILLMAEHNLKLREVARQTNYCAASIVYRAKRILKKTGLDPRCFYDLVILVDMLKEEGDSK